MILTGGVERNGTVTLLAEHPPDEPPDTCRLRFRAERPGETGLGFEARPGGPVARVTVRIAAEKVPGEDGD